MRKGQTKQICINGHDTFICGRDKYGVCKDCRKEAHPSTPGQPRKRICKNDHDTSILGRYKSSGQCIQCQRNSNKTEKKREQHKKYVLEHRVEITAKSRKRNTAWKLMKKYNLTLDNYNKMIEIQNGLCGGCSRSQDEFKNPLSVDHDHTCCSGKQSCGKCIRGLLCQPCNLVLGNAQDNIEVLKGLIKYLEKWNKS